MRQQPALETEERAAGKGSSTRERRARDTESEVEALTPLQQPKMGRKKRQKTELVEDMPFCFYCGDEFPDDWTLREHQVTAHFKCPECNTRIQTPRELRNHARSSHGLEVKKVCGALPGRDWVDLEIVGQEEIPEPFLGPGNRFPEGETEIIVAHLDRKQQAMLILNSFSLQGVVKSYAAPKDGRKGWGFIIRDPRDESSPSGDAPEDIFVHESELSAAVEGDEKPIMLTAGQRVYYSTKEDKRYGTQAADVRPVLGIKDYRPGAKDNNGEFGEAAHVAVVVTGTGKEGQPIIQPLEPQVGGTVKSFSPKDKWGFIIPDGGGPDIFLMDREIQAPDGARIVYKGQRVTFNVKIDRGRPQARMVIPGEMADFIPQSSGAANASFAAQKAYSVANPGYQPQAAYAYQQPAAAAGGATALPAGWSAAMDPATGSPYYIDPQGTSHWELPKAVEGQGPPPADQQPMAVAYAGADPAAAAAMQDPATAAVYQAQLLQWQTQQAQQAQWGGGSPQQAYIQQAHTSTHSNDVQPAGAAQVDLTAPLQPWEKGGFVKSFNHTNQYGFIVPDGGGEEHAGGKDVFCHQREIISPPGYPDTVLKPGDRVYYTPSFQNSKPQAKSVRHAPAEQSEADMRAERQAKVEAGDAMAMWKAAMMHNEAAQAQGLDGAGTQADKDEALKEWKEAAARAAASGGLQGAAAAAATAISNRGDDGDGMQGPPPGVGGDGMQGPPPGASDGQGPPPGTGGDGMQGAPPGAGDGMQGPPPGASGDGQGPPPGAAGDGMQGPPPGAGGDGMQGPPPGAAAAAAAGGDGLQGPPPAAAGSDGLQGPPPGADGDGMQGPPPGAGGDGMQGPPPGGLQGPPPAAQ